MKGASTRFVVCLTNRGYPASLVVRRLYIALPDASAHRHRMIRVIDESGEDYLYPDRMFGAVDLPRAVEKQLAATRA